MRVALFYHSLVSDWNHGNAHFLRGIAAELIARGVDLQIYEPEDSWSLANLKQDSGSAAVEKFRQVFPQLQSTSYDRKALALDTWLADVDLALVHEWNDPQLVAAIGRYRRSNPHFRVLFHDTHHRAITQPEQIGAFELDYYDGVLAYGESLKQAYQKLGWAGRQVHVWHEAADVRTFFPRASSGMAGDIVWIGNWGDEERTEELREYLFRPVEHLALRAEIYGVRYPATALEELSELGISYRGWLPNFEVPQVFANFRVTVHVPRRPYTRQLRGIPTIRPFEALACGIPLISAPWEDSEGLFRVGEDFLMAQNGRDMEKHIHDVLHDPSLARQLTQSGLETIRARHTCGHRVDELFKMFETMGPLSAQRGSMFAGVAE